MRNLVRASRIFMVGAIATILIVMAVSASGAESVTKQTEPTKQEISRIPSLDTVTPFAGFAAAIAIAYASLPNYRHRKAVQDYVRKIIERDGLLDYLKKGTTVNTVLCSNQSWAILFNFGLLHEVHPDLRPTVDSDKYFQGMIRSRLYTHLFQNNLDKMVSIFLGFISASVLWFAAYDDVHFFEASTRNDLRIHYLMDIETFFVVSLSIIFVSAIIYIIVHDKHKNEKNLFKNLWKFYAIYFGLSTAMIVSACWNWPIVSRVSILFITPDTLHVFRYIQFSILASATFPAFMWGIGNYLSQHIIGESENCAVAIAAIIGTSPTNASLPPP